MTNRAHTPQNHENQIHVPQTALTAKNSGKKTSQKHTCPENASKPKNSQADAFDFLFGSWHVQHRRLTQRLKKSEDWQEFGGHMNAHPILNGQGNIDDNWLDLPGDPYRAISLRTYDPADDTWAIWWLDSRRPQALDVPVKGWFEKGTGLFFADDILDGSPIKVRFRWTKTDTPTPRWEQAFSPDGGLTWEINWTMDFSRRGDCPTLREQEI